MGYGGRLCKITGLAYPRSGADGPQRRLCGLFSAFFLWAAAHCQRSAAFIWQAKGEYTDNARRRLCGAAPLGSFYGHRGYVEAGGLLSYGPNFPDLVRRAATFVDKILKGAKPGDLPVEQPTKFKPVINLKTSQTLGLTIPPILLFQAEEVIR